MNKKSFYRNINITLGIILALHVFETIALHWQFASNHPLVDILVDSKNILLSFLIIFVILYISIIIYHPIKMRRSVKVLLHIFEEFRVGNYSYKASDQEDKLEKEFQPLIETVDKVFFNVTKFDKLKETKIFTHHSRIRGIIGLISEGAMIIDNSGDIIYINDVISSNYSFLEEEVNILENVFDTHFEEGIKKYIKEVINEQMKIAPRRLFLKGSDEEITIKSNMYKNKTGDVLGAVFIISGLEDTTDKNKNLVKKIL